MENTHSFIVASMSDEFVNTIDCLVDTFRKTGLDFLIVAKNKYNYSKIKRVRYDDIYIISQNSLDTEISFDDGFYISSVSDVCDRRAALASITGFFGRYFKMFGTKVEDSIYFTNSNFNSPLATINRYYYE